MQVHAPAVPIATFLGLQALDFKAAKGQIPGNLGVFEFEIPDAMASAASREEQLVMYHEFVESFHPVSKPSEKILQAMGLWPTLIG